MTTAAIETTERPAPSSELMEHVILEHFKGFREGFLVTVRFLWTQNGISRFRVNWHNRDNYISVSKFVKVWRDPLRIEVVG